MYGSFRFFIDRWPCDICATSVLEIIDLFSIRLGAPFSRLIHVLHNPDEDRPKVYIEYPNNESGRKSFVSNEFVSLFTGKYGDVSAPSVKATCDCSRNAVYSCISIEVQLPFKTTPMILRVDFDCSYIQNSLSLGTYALLLSNLHDLGFEVNNSFLHLYRKISTAITLDGGQVGSIISFDEKRNIKQAISHRKKGNMNCMMDVFSINSIRDNIISEKTQAKIADIVGCSSVANIAENFIFSLPVSDSIPKHYRSAHGNIVKRIRKMLRAEGVVS